MASTYTYYVLTIFLLCSVSVSAKTQNNITSSNLLRDPETLVSNNGFFEMGFFNPPNSSNQYLGIWYYEKYDNGVFEVVWVANRDNPLINDSSGVLEISQDGNLQVLNAEKNIFWSSNLSSSTNSSSSIALLQDSGNFVLYEDDSGNGNAIWQSFDHPTNSLLQLMEITANKNQQLISWRNYSDPSDGRFASGIRTQNKLTEVFIWKDDQPYYRSGPWNGNVFIGVPLMNSVLPDGFNLVEDGQGILSLSFSSPNKSTLAHKILGSDGIVNTKVWDYGNRKWEIEWTSHKSNCDIYGYCGRFGSCNSRKSPLCSCLKGFEPKNKEEWGKGNWSRGCYRRTPLQCGSKTGKIDGFLKLSRMKTPADTVWLSSDNEEGCRSHCLMNCHCFAYARYDGIGCMVWNGTLVDLQEFSVDGVDLYIRLADAELAKTSKVKIILPLIIIAAVTILFAAMCFLWRWRTRRNAKKVVFTSTLSQAELQDLPLFTFDNLMNATHNFDETNKLGRGGFGPVYKGKLEDGQQIAVKRLATTSGQGIQEFMNEVVVISKLQHINLVRLLGCCVEGDEKMLVYEYMPNSSLDALLFDPMKGKNLDWKKRFNIIEGICRGLLYLHRDSRLRIIHRDLKASNILLDEDLNPKISDFGMARIFRRNEDRANTIRVVGTYGYMSPEYAMKGLFSEKSDVFSLGVLLLEIISGKSINSFDDDDGLGLVGYAWKLWNEDNILSFIDATIYDPEFRVDMVRCMQLALLCVQEYPEERPNISAVVYMLHCEIATLPHPKQPGFTQKRSVSLNELDPYAQYDSVNFVSLTCIVAR